MSEMKQIDQLWILPTEFENLQSYVDKANVYCYNFLNLIKRKL